MIPAAELDLAAYLLDAEDGNVDESGSSVLSEDGEEKENELAVKRRKHRESMARIRRHWRSKLLQLSEEERILQRRLVRHLREVGAVVTCGIDCRPDMCLRVAYIRLVQTHEAILREQDRLLEAIQEHLKLQRIIHVAQERLRESPEPCILDSTTTTRTLARPHGGEGGGDGGARTHGPNERGGRDNLGTASGFWFRFFDAEGAFFYRPETEASCVATIRAALGRIQALEGFFETNAAVMGTEPLHCLGWTVRRHVGIEGPSQRYVVRVSSSRRLPPGRTTADELAAKTWSVFTTPELLHRVTCGRVRAKVLQRVNDDTAIVLRNAPDPDGHHRFHQLSLVTRLVARHGGGRGGRGGDGGGGSNQLRSSIPSSLSPPPPLGSGSRGGENRIAMILLTVLDDDQDTSTRLIRFRAGDDGEVIVEYVGSWSCADVDHARFLMTESLAMLTRWEHAVIPPELIVPEV